MSLRRTQTRRTALAHVLRGRRLETGLRQTDVADRLGVPQSFVSKYERGERSLTLMELESICEVLEMDVVDLILKYRNEKT